MSFTKRLVALAGTSALLVSAGACSKDATDPLGHRVEQQSDAVVDTTIFERAGGEGNAIVFESPVEMAMDRTIAGFGKVVGFTDGYEVLERGTEKEGYDIRDRTVVMQVEVTELYKGSKDALDASGSIYLTLPRGAAQEGVEDDGGRSTITPVEEFERAIPKGSEVVIIAGPVTLPEGPTTEVIDPQRGVPKGSTLFSGWHPQALTFDTTDGGTSSWGGRSLDSIRQELDDRF